MHGAFHMFVIHSVVILLGVASTFL
jgi:hypothetical protein